MREKPDLQDADIKDCLFTQYGLQAAEVAFLPRGGDINAAVYHIITWDGTPYFLKLRSGILDDISLVVPKFLSDRGIRAVIAPILTRSRQLWTQLDDFHVILYPFVEGHNAFEAALTERQWVDFGTALRAIHNAVIPSDLGNRVPHETYSPQWRERVKTLLKRIKTDTYPEPVAAQYAGFMSVKADEILYIVQMAEQLRSVLQAQAPIFTLCHSDLHAGNLLIDANSSLYIVDWDFPIFAPKERDLMFIGGGVGSTWYAPQEEALFYKGYGPTEINPVALAYYRFERIVQDIAEWGERMLLTDTGGQDRARWLQGLKRWFQPNDVVEMAYKAEKLIPPELR